jgi:hypothetical protein
LETKETAVVTFRVEPEELQRIDTQAAKAKLNRAEYVRSLVLAAINGHDQATVDEVDMAELDQKLNALTDKLAAQFEPGNDRQPEPEEPVAAPAPTRRCYDPEHTKIFGCGHCFICNIPMYDGLEH